MAWAEDNLHRLAPAFISDELSHESEPTQWIGYTDALVHTVTKPKLNEKKIESIPILLRAHNEEKKQEKRKKKKQRASWNRRNENLSTRFLPGQTINKKKDRYEKQ